MLDVQTIEHALAFLGRATLTGNEVQAFCNVSNALQAERAKLISAQVNAPGASEEAPKQDAAPGE